MLNLAVGSIRLRRIDGAFVLVLDEIAIKFLGLLKFPAHGATSFYLFGNPNGATRPGKLGWYAVYNQQPPKKAVRRAAKSRARLRKKKRGT